MKKIRFIERDYIKSRIKAKTEYLSEEKINEILDELDHRLCDLTFTFDNKYISGVMIYDNKNKKEICYEDLNSNADEFYQEQNRVQVGKYLIRIRNILCGEKEVVHN